METPEYSGVEPDIWYSIAECFPWGQFWASNRSAIRPARPCFMDHELELMQGVTCSQMGARYPWLHLVLRNVERRDLDGLPDNSTLANRLIRENQVCLPQVQYGFCLELRLEDKSWKSIGKICIDLKLGIKEQTRTGRHDEVDTAHARGLLDDHYWQKANFRLNLRPALAEYEAVRSSGYLSDEAWSADVHFAQWRDEQSGEWVLSPIENEIDLNKMQFRVCTVDYDRGFRMTDLFKTPIRSSTSQC